MRNSNTLRFWRRHDAITAADGTHTSPAGAELNAACAAEGLRELKDCELKDYLLPEKK